MTTFFAAFFREVSAHFAAVSCAQNLDRSKQEFFTARPSGDYGPPRVRQELKKPLRGYPDATSCMHPRDCSRHATPRFCADAAAPADAPPPPPPPPAAVPRRRRRPSRCRRRRLPSPAPMAPPAPAAAPAGPKLTWGAWLDTYYHVQLHPAPTAATRWCRRGSAPSTPNSNSFTLATPRSPSASNATRSSFQLDLGYGATGDDHQLAGGEPDADLPVARGLRRHFVLLQAYGTIALLGKLTSTSVSSTPPPAPRSSRRTRTGSTRARSLFNIIPLLHTGARANLQGQRHVVAAGERGERLEQRSATTTPCEDVRPVGDDHASPMAEHHRHRPTSARRAPQARRRQHAAATPLPRGLGRRAHDQRQARAEPERRLHQGTTTTSATTTTRSASPPWAAYVINDHVDVAARGEFVRTAHGLASVNDDVMEEVTVDASRLPMGKNFELRPEFRDDSPATDASPYGDGK